MTGPFDANGLFSNVIARLALMAGSYRSAQQHGKADECESAIRVLEAAGKFSEVDMSGPFEPVDRNCGCLYCTSVRALLSSIPDPATKKDQKEKA